MKIKLIGSGKRPSLDIRRDVKGTVFIENATEEIVESAEETQKILDMGFDKRKVRIYKNLKNGR